MRDTYRFSTRAGAVGLLAVVLAAGAVARASAAPTQVLPAALRADLTTYLHDYANAEHISAVSLSVSLAPGKPNVDVAAGTTQFGGNVPVTPAMLFQVGSNTKAFTAVTLLQLEADGKLRMDDRIGRWFPQYPAWRNITIRQLLNMTSGIPTYDVLPAMWKPYVADPYRFYSTGDLIAYVYPKTQFAPGHGWMYSNTAYLLSEMVIEAVTKHDYAVELRKRFFDGGPRLADVYYHTGVYPAALQARMVAGYFDSRDPDNAVLAPFLGRDMRPLSLSWAQGAGGIIATPHALTQWVRALYESPMLSRAQHIQLETLVSLKNGAPIAKTTLADPRGFGLGVAQLTAPQMPTLWFYEGMTLGYRMSYAYFPRSRCVIAVGLNSQPDEKQDHSGPLVASIYRTLKSNSQC